MACLRSANVLNSSLCSSNRKLRKNSWEARRLRAVKPYGVVFAADRPTWSEEGKTFLNEGGSVLDGNRSRVVEAYGGVVAADHITCSEEGKRILEKGGNAIDAAIAVALCQGILNPGASGIGGGGFGIVRLAKGKAEAYDFRETAPGLATAHMYNQEDGTRIGKSKGGLSVGVPGEVAGFYKMWSDHGTLAWKDLLQPSIALCTNGFLVEKYLAKEIDVNSRAILANKGLRDAFSSYGTLLKAGDHCSRDQLAKTLIQIAEHGPGVFYGGDIGKSLVQDVQTADGIITVQDLEKYEVKVREPIVTETWGYKILGMPPPSCGGAGLTLILNILAGFGVDGIKGDVGTHRLIEAFKHAYAMRMNLGDPEFSDINSIVQNMICPTFAEGLRLRIDDRKTHPPEFYGKRWEQLNDHGTTHICVVDAERNAVSMTTTINYSFGSKLLSESTGVILNNQMNDFSTPNFNTTGALAPSKVNFIEPFKRPLSTMSPTIVLEKGQLRAVIGGSGGSKILTTVAQVLLNHIAGHNPHKAVMSPRVHHQLEPNLVFYENYTYVAGEHVEVPSKTRAALEHVGHDSDSAKEAVCQFVLHDHSKPVTINGNGVHVGKLTAVSDLRKNGYPAGY